MSLGVYLRKTLAKNDTKKSLWAASVLALSFITLVISWKNIGLLRELLVFIMALIQGAAAIAILVTFIKLNSLKKTHRLNVEKKRIVSYVQPTL